MSRNIIYGLIMGIVIGASCFGCDMLFYRAYLGDAFKMNGRKYVALLLSVIGSIIGSSLLFIYGMDSSDIFAEIVAMNATCFLGYVDKRYKVVPNKYLKGLLMIAAIILCLKLVFYMLTGRTIVVVLLSAIMGAAVSFICFFITSVFSRGGLGGGDIKLMTVLGFMLGYRRIIPLIIISVFINFCYCAFLLIRKKITLKDEIPMVPHIAVAMVIVTLLGI